MGAFGQLAHFVGHDGQAYAVLSGTRGLAGSLERKQLGLIGNVFDGGKDIADANARSVEVADQVSEPNP